MCLKTDQVDVMYMYMNFRFAGEGAKEEAAADSGVNIGSAG